MKKYQLNYLLPADLEPKKSQVISLDLEKLVQEKKGVLIGERKNKPISLGQEINKIEKVNFLNIKFQIEKNQLEDLKQEINKISEVLRFMILVEEPDKPIKPKRRIKPVKKETKPKVELKQIEEKLEQILDESK